MPRLCRGSVLQMQALNELVVFMSRAPKLIDKPVRYFLIALRGRLCMSQEQLAKRSGVAQGQISRIELGRVEPDIATLRKLYDAMFCDLLVIPRPRRRPSEVVGDLVISRDPMYKRGLGLWKD